MPEKQPMTSALHRARYALGDPKRPFRCPPGIEHVWSYTVGRRECRNCHLVQS